MPRTRSERSTGKAASSRVDPTHVVSPTANVELADAEVRQRAYEIHSARNGHPGEALDQKHAELLRDGARMCDDSSEPELSEHLYQHTQRLLVQVEDALRRIEAGSYGVCEGTEHRIGLARLRAIPWARRCFECALNGDRRS